MRALLIVAVFLAACGGGSKEQKKDEPPKQETPPPAPEPIPEPVIITSQADAPVVTVRMVFKAGSIDDPAGQGGVTEVMAALMTEGTQALDAAALKKALYPYATAVDSWVDAETMGFEMTVHKDVASKALPIFFDILLTPRMDARDFERLRADAISDIETRLRQADDESLGKASLAHFLWAGHPYGAYPGGSVTTLKALTIDQVQAQRARLITQARLVAGIAGGYTPEVEQLFRDAIGKLPRGEAWKPAPLPQVTQPKGIQIHIIEKDAEGTPITMGFHYALNRRDPDFYAMMVANSAFGEHRQMGGRLFYRMRELRGLNYGDYSYLEHFVQEGHDTFALLNIPRREHAFTIWLRPVEADDRIFALRQSLRELRALVDKGLTQEEFERTRDFLKGYSLLWEQGTSRRLGYLVDDHLNGTPGFLAGLRKALETMTLEQVNAAIKKHLQPDNLVVTILAKDAQALKTALVAGTPSPRSPEKTRNQDAEMQKEDAEIAGYDLKLTPESVDITPVTSLF